MAHSRNNVITRTYSGKFGNVCMQHDGIIRSLPGKSKKPRSEKQLKHLSRFELAKDWGRKAVAYPGLTAHYAVYRKRWKKKLKNTGVWQLAIKDFMNLPRIWDAALVRSDERSGSLVRIKAWDKFEVTRVGVSLTAPDGRIAEEGEAILTGNQEYYEYVIRDPLLMRPGITCRVSASDVPGNVVEKDFMLFE